MAERRPLPIAALILLLAWLVVPAGGGRAAPDDAYTVSGIAVDATAESGAAARDKAIAEGQREAFGRLLQRLVGEGSAQPPGSTTHSRSPVPRIGVTRSPWLTLAVVVRIECDINGSASIEM